MNEKSFINYYFSLFDEGLFNVTLKILLFNEQNEG